MPDVPRASDSRTSQDLAVAHMDHRDATHQQDVDKARTGEDPRKDSPHSKSSKSQSPVIEIMEPDYIDTGREATMIRVDDEEEESFAYSILEQFPYANQLGHVAAAKRVSDHIRNGRTIA